MITITLLNYTFLEFLLLPTYHVPNAKNKLPSKIILQNGIFSQKSKFLKLYCYKNFSFRFLI